MRKIATITFHWATNYGAVLQAYALQRYLLQQGYETEIINYTPWSVLLLQEINWRRRKQNELFIREKKLEEFRKKYLIRTKRVMRSRSLSRFSDCYDAVLSGSDQIWNNFFTLKGEFQPTFAYFLDFVGKNTKRISYAASFGMTEISEAYAACVTPYIRKFDAISVREATGKEIVRKLRMDAEQVCDPTLLLRKEDYLQLIRDEDISTDKVFAYILRSHPQTQKIAECAFRLMDCEPKAAAEDGLLEWLSQINGAEMVVSNSFHCIMLSLILNRPFIAVLTEGSGMNDRLLTILEWVGLEQRAVEKGDESKTARMIAQEIDWKSVNEKLEQLRQTGIRFLDRALASV